MRPPVDDIHAPEFPIRLPWFNAPPLTMGELSGRPVLIEFWDFCRANSLRTLGYMRAWHERYGSRGLEVIGVHTSGFECSEDPAAVREAVGRLGIEYPVVVDSEREIWRLYGNLGWPARYLFDQESALVHYHYGEGGYDGTELAIQELLGVSEPLLEPLKLEDVPGVRLRPQTEDVPGPYSGPYEAGAVWAVLDGHGRAHANGRTIAVDHPGCYELVSHPRSTVAELQLELEDGVRCHAVCFTPGLDPAGS